MKPPDWPALKAELHEVEALVDRIKPILAGQGAPIQGAVLADLLATWLAGHIALGDPKSTAIVREEMLRLHLAAVRDLIPINEAEIMGRTT